MRLPRIPASVGNYTVTATVAVTVAAVGYVLYRQHVLGDPFRIIRDAEGVLRYQTRLDQLQERAAAARAALADDPASRRRQFDAWLADKELKEEVDRLVAAHGQESLRPLRDEDLR
jgi:hypothetical protein